MTAASRRQVGKLIGLLAALDIRERDERLAVLSALIYHKVESTNQLTVSEASVCIDTLDAIARRTDPAAYLAKLTEAAERYFAGAAS